MPERLRALGAFLFLLLLTVAGCGPAETDLAGPDSAESGPRTAMVAASPGPATERPASLPRKIIYTALLRMTTAKFDESVRKLNEAVAAHRGYVAEQEISGTAGAPKSGTWKVRIPTDRFSAFMTALGSVGEISNTKLTSEDVSEEFYDVAARLKNKRAEEERLLQLLRTTTGKLQDILAVEKELNRVREEIERIEGRLRFLSNRADLTTVTITLEELPSLGPDSARPFGVQVWRTLVASLAALSDFAKGLVLTLVALTPWAILATGVLLPFFHLHRRRMRDAGKPSPRSVVPVPDDRNGG
ncbi:MAG: DUF4349 domain-containing protein [Capsulimonadales bacterium]|nr:DUF4349 domain-containing protein [Capsulimonadales bacterium]